MKKLIAAAALLAGAAVSANAAANPYVRGDVSLDTNNEVEFEFADGATATAEQEDDFNFGVAAGKGFGPWRGEVEVRYAKGDTENFFSTFESETITGFVNGYYDIATGGPIQPFVGAGIGYGRLEIEETIDGSSGDDSGFAWQLIGGVAVPLNTSWTLDSTVRYQQLTGLETDEEALFGGDPADKVDVETDGTIITVGLRKNF